MEDKKSFMYVIVSALLPTHHTVVDQKIKGICTSAIPKMDAYGLLEIPASRVFLGADAQLLGTSLAGVRKSLSICLNH